MVMMLGASIRTSVGGSPSAAVTRSVASASTSAASIDATASSLVVSPARWISGISMGVPIDDVDASARVPVTDAAVRDPRSTPSRTRSTVPTSRSPMVASSALIDTRSAFRRMSAKGSSCSSLTPVSRAWKPAVARLAVITPSSARGSANTTSAPMTMAPRTSVNRQPRIRYPAASR